MKITIDIPNKTIQIHGSFKYEEYRSMWHDLPAEWKEFKFEIVPVYVETRPFVHIPFIVDTITSPPGYPTTTTTATYNSTLDALNSCSCNLCKCNDVAEKPETPPNQPSLFDN